MQDDYKAQLTKATEGLHYCDLILTAQEAEDLRALVQVLQGTGRYPGLSDVFRMRIPRHPATQSALIWPGIPGPSGHLFHGHPAGQSERSDAGVA
ncbi:hypothetical protein, partial [Pseudomonas putida]|uniref:hypothetical protein n=1 Tax=Pseudomonas putida TaxID=303 RepID=UPI0010758BDC